MQIEILGSRWKNSTKASQEEEWNIDKFSLMCISMIPGYKKRESNSLSKTDERAKVTSEAGTEVCFHLCYTALSETKPECFPAAASKLT